MDYAGSAGRRCAELPIEDSVARRGAERKPWAAFFFSGRGALEGDGEKDEGGRGTGLREGERSEPELAWVLLEEGESFSDRFGCVSDENRKVECGVKWLRVWSYVILGLFFGNFGNLSSEKKG